MSAFIEARGHMMRIRKSIAGAVGGVAAAVSVALAGPGLAASPPGPPTNVAINGTTDTSATVSWSAPASDGGSPITVYVATATPAVSTNPTQTCTTTGLTSCTINGLANSAVYSISVAAGNPDLGPASAPVQDFPIYHGQQIVHYHGPFISTVAPFYGTHKGGTRLTLRGVKLNGATKVTFNGVKGTHLVVVSSTEIRITTPKGAIGPANIVVKTPKGTGLSSAFSYVQ